MDNAFIENGYPCHVPDRVMDGPFLNFDLYEVIGKIKQEDTWKKGERNAITLLKNSYMRIVLIALHQQMEISFHQSDKVMSLQLIEGKINFKTGDESLMLQKGSLLILHDDVQHTLSAIEETTFLLTIAVRN
jgi:quercetin dioxygenase-like cupin family protein